MPAGLILALDSGTTSCRALIFDLRGELRASARRELSARYPRPGWVEQSADGIWRAQLEAAREAVVAVDPAEIAAIGIANQRETAVIWDRETLEPIGPAIVWQCRRTADAVAALSDDQRARIQRRTGLIPDAYFTGPKFAWLLDHVDGARGRAERGELAAGTVDSWLIARLGGGERHLTDRTNASRTMLWNLAAGEWDGELAEWQRVPRGMLPEVRGTAGDFGVAAAEHLGAEIPIAAAAGDQQASLAALGSREDAAGVATYGTGAFVLAPAPADAAEDLLVTAAADGGIALEGGVFTAGAAVDWACGSLGLADDAAQLCKLAGGVPDSAGVDFLPALSGLGAPHWQADARGSFSGLSLAARREHLARAVLEGIAGRVGEIVGAMRRAGARVELLRAAGGLARSDVFLQIQADALGIPVERPAQVEATAYGAAMLAAAGAGLPPLPAVSGGRRFEPALP